MSIWDRAGAFLIGLIARWSFKVLAGVLLALGVTQDRWEEILASVVTFIIGALISHFQNKYLAQKDPNAP